METTEVLIATGVVVLALLVSVFPGRLLTGWVLRRIDRGAVDNGVLRGGAWIGMLERVAITGTMVAGLPEGVAVVLAVKGLGRYPELREAHPDRRSPAAERFIIGTLTSYVWAGLCGGVCLAVLQGLS
ncbi:hypothetical protein PU560_17330 [Georgenia sp. 10Sc9-8]|uniref:Uncharacterized protein n=1 Tax=Georgenia halotolerans TaxID=3028317 RepID=A0ABT5U3Z9_9MICO|nr:hypothetical protein [Georgenia halotolerans]